MLIVLASNATTVVETFTETVTVTPPNVPAEFVKQSSVGLSGKDWVTIFTSFASLLVSTVALVVTIRSWIYSAPKGVLGVNGLYIPSVTNRTIRIPLWFPGEKEDLEARYPRATPEELFRKLEEDVREAGAFGGVPTDPYVTVILFNKGRMKGTVRKLYFTADGLELKQEIFPYSSHCDFPWPWSDKGTEKIELVPGDYAQMHVDIKQIIRFAEEQRIDWRKIRFCCIFAGKTLFADLPASVVSRYEKWQIEVGGKNKN